MTTSVNTLRQSVLYAEREVTFDDLVSGTAKAVIYLRPNTLILSGFMDVTEAWDAATSATIKVGDTYTGGGDDDRYLVATTVAATGLTKFTLPPVTASALPNNGALTVTATVVSATALTEGKARIGITYVEVDGRRSTEFNTQRQ